MYRSTTEVGHYYVIPMHCSIMLLLDMYVCFFVALPYMANSFNRDLVDEQDAKSIRDSMFGRQTRLLVTIGHGYHGLADRIVEPLMSPRDRQDNFVLLWAIGNNS